MVSFINNCLVLLISKIIVLSSNVLKATMNNLTEK